MLKTKLALKRLTGSDLTFFEWHYRNRPAGNQKAINLNRNVLVDQLYPALPDAAAEQDGRLPLDLRILGPGNNPELNLQRKIIKFGTYKNWRLNGEFIYNPPGQPTRFDELQPNDFAVIEFSGPLVPISARMVLVGAQYQEDAALHQVLALFLGDEKMKAMTLEQLARLVEDPRIPQTHAIHTLALDDTLEDAAQGGSEGLERLWAGIGKQQLSYESLQKARRNAEEIGQVGEGMVSSHLEALQNQGIIKSYVWVSADNAIAPYDFAVVEDDGKSAFIDVKATAGEFSRKIHVSLNELRQMANGTERYDLYRLYAIDISSAKLRIARNVRQFSTGLLSALRLIPSGITPDGFSVDPGLFNFGQEISIEVVEPEDE